jgi:hypothetical protein
MGKAQETAEGGELITRCTPQSLGRIPDLLAESWPAKENRDDSGKIIGEESTKKEEREKIQQ